jgi:hypothetical protein
MSDEAGRVPGPMEAWIEAHRVGWASVEEDEVHTLAQARIVDAQLAELRAQRDQLVAAAMPVWEALAPDEEDENYGEILTDIENEEEGWIGTPTLSFAIVNGLRSALREVLLARAREGSEA